MSSRDELIAEHVHDLKTDSIGTARASDMAALLPSRLPNTY